MNPVNQEATQSTLKLQQDDAMFEKDGPFKLMPHDEFFYRIYDRCVERNDVDFDVLMTFSDTIISYQVREIDFHEADKIFRDIFRDDPDLYVESTHVMSSRVVEDSSGSSVSVLDLLKRGGKKQSIIVEKIKWSVYEEVMMLKEYNLCEVDMWLGTVGSLAEKMEKSPEKLEEALTANDLRMIKTIYSPGHEISEEMVEILQSDRVRYKKARDVLVMRLRERKQYLEETKLQLIKTWNEIFEDIEEKGKVCRYSNCVEDMKKASRYLRS